MDSLAPDLDIGHSLLVSHSLGEDRLKIGYSNFLAPATLVCG